MTDVNWHKPKHPKKKRSERIKFIGAGLLISGRGAVSCWFRVRLQGARYFITVRELLDDASYLERTVRIAGAVDGESIDYDSEKAIHPL